jgi:hypothetical protein
MKLLKQEYFGEEKNLDVEYCFQIFGNFSKVLSSNATPTPTKKNLSVLTACFP